MKIHTNLLGIRPCRNAALRAAMILAMSFTAVAQLAPVLSFKDTFDVSQPSNDINFEINKRQSGAVAPLTYAKRADTDDLIQLGSTDTPGRLRLKSSSYVSPNHNFVEGGQFTIEFDIDPGIDDATSSSPDWAAVVFGATGQNVFVNASDGMGILFRINGDIEVWDGAARAYGGNGDFPGGIPKTEAFHVRIDVQTDNFRGEKPATIKMSINGTPVRIGTGTGLEFVKQSGFKANFITLEGLGFPGPWTHIFDNLTVAAVPCIDVAPTFVDQLAGKPGSPVTVTIPASLNATNAAQVTVISQNPSVAVPSGADGSGKLTLKFAAGGPASQTFAIKAISAGTAILSLAGDTGVCVNNSVKVNVSAGVGLQETVFQDNFNVSANNLDINFENDRGRQSGTAGILTYAERPEHMAGGSADEFTQVSNSLAPGKLYLRVTDFTWASPNYNFTDGGQFTIEVSINPSVQNPDRTSDDWAAVVFGATAQGRFVNGSDGMGILFRSNGQIQVFDGTTAVFSSTAADALPAGELKVKIDVTTPDFSGSNPATVALSVNGMPVKISTDAMTYTKPTGFKSNFITLEGFAAAGNDWVDTFDDLKISAAAFVNFRSPNIVFAPAQKSTNIVIKIPAQLNAKSAVSITLSNSNPATAVAAGSANGVLTLNFAAGGSITQAVTLNVVGKGRAIFSLSNTNGIGVGQPLAVTVPAGLVANPSFENNPPTAFPTLGPIDSWTGGTGVNTSRGPFHDNGSIPDRLQVAHVQGTKTLQQTIHQLVPGKQYWLQFRYNARSCCGGAVPDLTVRFDDADLDTITGIKPVGGTNAYYSRTVLFTPKSDSGDLVFSASATGDATTLIDAVTIVQRDTGNVVVQNPSFEASGEPPAPGVIAPASISGWIGTGTYGVNFSGAGPFADNGANPDQDLVAFLQGKSSLSQNLSGLVAGENYTVSYSYNARLGNQPHLKVTAGDIVLQDDDVKPVGAAAAYLTKTATFKAAVSSAALTFAQTADGDQTVLLDNVIVTGKALVLPPIAVSPIQFDIDVAQKGSLVTVVIPPQLNQSSPAVITITSLNSNVAVPAGGQNGILDLKFDVGASTTNTFEIQPTGTGAAKFQLSNKLGAQFDHDQITINVSGSFVRNPSFENNSNPAFPGYGPIDGWAGDGAGNAGLNNSGGPFQDNGIIPDRNQVALLQTDKTITQPIFRLVPGKPYWLQFYFNTRNCCGGSIDLTARFAGSDLATFAGLTPVGKTNAYNFTNLVFTPTASSGDLQFATTSSGDATALLDAISIVQRDPGNVLLQNPSFEASGNPPFPGYIQPKQMAGWTGAGNYGVNVSGAGPFADNGVNADQGNVGFIQGPGASLSQMISGLKVGQPYTLSYSYNARSGNKPHLKVTIGNSVAQDDDTSAVGGTNRYPVRVFVFTPEAAVLLLTFAQTAAGDNTVLLDNVMITEGAVAQPPRLGVQRQAGNQLRINWPASAAGFGLQTARKITGPWSDSTANPTAQGDQNVIADPIDGTSKFYRLKKK